MIVSIAIAVLPVWRSPMISSRWPRPIGIIASIALMPVCSGSVTGWRWTTPGALNSAGRISEVMTSPLPSSGLPSGSTMRPSRASPTGISSSLPVRLTVSPSTTFCQSPNSTTPTLSDSRFSARPVTSCGSSSISNDMQFSSPWMRAMPSATDSTVPTSVRSAPPVSRPSMRVFRIEVISSGLICMRGSWLLDVTGAAAVRWLGPRPRVHGGARGRAGRGKQDAANTHAVLASPMTPIQRRYRASSVRVWSWVQPSCLRDVLAKLVEAVLDRGVEDRVADAQDDAPEDAGVDRARQLDALSGLLPDPLADRLHRSRVEVHRAGYLDGQQLVLLIPQPPVLGTDAEDDRHPVTLEQRLEEVDDRRVCIGERLVQAVLLLLRREVWREEEHAQVGVLVQRIGELPELLAHEVELVVLLRDLEEGARVDLGDLLHGLVPTPLA